MANFLRKIRHFCRYLTFFKLLMTKFGPLNLFRTGNHAFELLHYIGDVVRAKINRIFLVPRIKGLKMTVF